MDNIQELREIVNPVFNTAKACVQLVAGAGDEDSQKLLEILGFDRISYDLQDVMKLELPNIKLPWSE